MANEAVFQEILQISVDTDKFTQDIQKVQQIYADALKNMPNIGGVGAASLSASIADLNKTISQISTGGTQVIKDLGTAMLDTANSVSTSMSAMTEGVSTALSKVNAQLAEFKSQAQSGGGGSRNSSGGIFGNFGATLANATKYLLAYKAVNEAITLTGDVISAPFKAIKEGFEYLQNFEERSSQLKATLLQTEEFSKNQADNFRLAGEESERLTRNIDQMAIKLHTSSQTIQMALSAFLEFGGRNLVNSNDDAIQVAGLSAAALQSINPKMQSRQVISEIQKMVQGSATDASKLAAAFGVSAAQLQQMVTHAKEHHDLLQQIELHATGLKDRLDEAGQRQLSLAATAELIKQRWEGLVAGPLFKEYTKFLQEAIGWVNDHDGQLKALGKTIGDILDNVLSTFKSLLAADWEGFLTTFKVMAELLLKAAESITLMVSGVNQISDVGRLLFGNSDQQKSDEQKIEEMGLRRLQAKSAGHPYGPGDSDTDFAKLQNQRAVDAELYKGKQYADIEKQHQSLQDMAQLDAQLHAIDFSKMAASVKDPERANTPITDIHGKGENDRQALQDEYKQRIAIIKDAQEEVRKEIADAEAAHTTTVKEGEAKRVASYKEEYEQQRQAALEYLAKVNSDPNLKPEQKLHARAQVNQQILAAEKQFQEAEADGERKTSQEKESINKTHLQGELDRAKQHQTALLALYKEMAANRLITNEQLAKAEAEAEDHSFSEQAHDIEAKMGMVARGTAQYAQYEEQLATLKQKYADQELINIQKIQAAAKKDYDEQIKNEQELLSLQAQRLGLVRFGSSATSARRSSVAGAKAGVDAAGYGYAQSVQQLFNAEHPTDPSQKVSDAKLEELRNAVEKNKLALDQATDAYKNSRINNNDPFSSKGDFADRFQEMMFGNDSALQQVFGGKGTQGQGNGPMDRITAGADMLAKTFQNLGGEINQKQQAFDQGGVLGGIGSIMSQGMTGKLLGAIPIAGPIINAVGGVFSFFGDMMMAKAKHIADSINKQVQSIDQQYSLGQITLNDAITQLNQQKQNAIQQLSGVKGGSKQLSAILPQLDQQIQQLQKQARDTMTAFEQQLTILQLHGSELQSWANSWQQINQQVKTYLDAGGSIQNANAYLQENLNLLQQGLKDNLNQGDQAAIQDAIQLNSLLKQRLDLQKQEAQSEFGLLTQDSIEKRGNSAITIGQQLTTMRSQFDQQMSDLNNQIDLANQKVAVEGKIFDINKSIADLQAQSNALTIASLNEQLDKYQQMKNLLASTNGMTFTGMPNTGSTPGVTVNAPITVNVDSSGSGGPDPRQVGDAVVNAIHDRLRQFSPSLL